MSRGSLFARGLVATLIAATAIAPALAQTAERADITSFSADSFARAQPTTALDMVKLLPGFRLIEGDSELRGYAGAGGNVLVDGRRPSSKQDTLEEVLKRIPARAVDHIELIRSGSSGFDMQGYAVIANIVRNRVGSLSGRASAEGAFYRRDYRAYRLGGDLTYGVGDKVFDLAGAIYTEIDDEHGFGLRNRYDAAGDPIRLAVYGQPEGNDVKEVSGSYQQGLAGGTVRFNGLLKNTDMFANISDRVTFPFTFDASGTERVKTRAREAGFQYNRSLSRRGQFELIGIRRTTGIDGTDKALSPGSAETTRELSDAAETIVRGVFRRQGQLVSIELSAEGALNVLDSHRTLEENGVVVPLPAANVRVEERRAELSLTTTWRLTPKLTVEAGTRYETSRLTQSGDSTSAKSLAFLKPRFLARWSPSPSNEFRLLIEREVGQLDFGNFVSSASLSAGTVTAGNKDLEPDSLWRAELAWERRFGGGSIILTARREAVSNVIDRVPVFTPGGVYDAVGNIGSGQRDEAEIDLILPFDKLGLKGVTLQGNALVRRSRATDPATGMRRPISGDVPIEGKISFTHDLSAKHLRWGVNFVLGQKEVSYKIDEVEIDRSPSRVELFVEYAPTSRWTVRAFAKNLTSSAATRVRERYTGLRGAAPIAYVEKRVLNSGLYFGLSAQWSFGK
ncbi:MAG: TonB-dependent receptor [Proteobacteria bacterium]|nr:TonB-dependent receptor [Pseudomonadota bacterium]